MSNRARFESPTSARRRAGWTAILATAVLATNMNACRTADDRDAIAGPPASPVRSTFQARVDAALGGLTVTEDGRLRAIAPPRAEADRALAADLLAEADATASEAYSLEAIDLYVQAITADPGLAAAYAGLGRALVEFERPKEAAAALRSALDLEPDRVAARALLADLLQAEGDFMAAITELETVLGTAPDDGPAHARLAVLLHYAGDDAGALAHLDEAERRGAAAPGELRYALVHGAPPRAAVRDGDRPTAKGAGKEPTGGFVGPQVRIDQSGGNRVDETSAAATDLLPGQVVAAWHDYAVPGTIRIAAGISQDGGQSWVERIVRAPAGLQSIFEADPMTAYDPRTGNLWVGGFAADPTGGGASHLFVARRNPGASFFQPATPVITSQNIDKPWMAAGRRHDNPNTTQLYVAYHRINPASGLLQYSGDLGATWSAQVVLPTRPSFLPRVGPNGELYIVSWTGFWGNTMVRSFDSGATVGPSFNIPGRLDFWNDSSRIPGQFRSPQFAYLAVDPNDGTLYLVFFDTTAIVGGNYDVDLYFSRSTDHGDTWTSSVVILDDPDPKAPGDQFFPWLEVDDRGRLHLLYYDTSNVIQDDSDPEGWIDAYYAVSSDRGDSWTRFRLTPTSFSSAGAFSPFLGAQFLGDYTGLTVAGGVAHPVYVSTQNGDLDVFTHAIDFGPPPEARDDFYATLAGTPLEIVWDDLLVNDLELSAGAAVCAHTDPAQGTLTPTPGGATYQPPPNFVGTDTIGYTVCGPAGSAEGTLSIEVLGGALVIADDFDDGIDPGWQAVAQGGGQIEATAAAALQGAMGLRAAVAGPGDRAYLQVASLFANNVNAMFQLDPRSMKMGVGETHVLLDGQETSGSTVTLFELQVNQNSAGYRLRARLFDEGGTPHPSDWIPIEGPVAVRVVWNNSEAPFYQSAVGLGVDGQWVGATFSGGGGHVNRLRVGVVGGVDAGTAGEHRIDSFIANWLLLR